MGDGRLVHLVLSHQPSLAASVAQGGSAGARQRAARQWAARQGPRVGVGRAVRRGAPGVERLLGAGRRVVLSAQRPGGRVGRRVEQGVEGGVVEPRGRGGVAVRGIHDGIHARPQRRRQAERARLARGVQPWPRRARSRRWCGRRRRIATTSACAVGSRSAVTRFVPSPSTTPSRTTTAPNGPPRAPRSRSRGRRHGPARSARRSCPDPATGSGTGAGDDAPSLRQSAHAERDTDRAHVVGRTTERRGQHRHVARRGRPRRRP